MSHLASPSVACPSDPAPPSAPPRPPQWSGLAPVSIVGPTIRPEMVAPPADLEQAQAAIAADMQARTSRRGLAGATAELNVIRAMSDADPSPGNRSIMFGDQSKQLRLWIPLKLWERLKALCGDAPVGALVSQLMHDYLAQPDPKPLADPVTPAVIEKRAAQVRERWTPAEMLTRATNKRCHYCDEPLSLQVPKRHSRYPRIEGTGRNRKLVCGCCATEAVPQTEGGAAC